MRGELWIYWTTTPTTTTAEAMPMESALFSARRIKTGAMHNSKCDKQRESEQSARIVGSECLN
jgi:hypothetical protein